MESYVLLSGDIPTGQPQYSFLIGKMGILKAFYFSTRDWKKI